MVNSTRSSQNAEDKENSNGRVTRSSKKAEIKAHPNVSDIDGGRKSPRKTPLKKTIASYSNTQKSEQVEKRTLPAPEATRKSERVEKKKTPSTLARSERTRNHSSSSPSDSKSAGSLGSISRQKVQKEKSVKQLTLEAKEVDENEEHNMETSKVKVKRMDAHMYRSLFRKRDCLGKSDKISKPNQQGDNSTGAKTDELSKGSCSDNKEVSKNGALPSEDAKAKETKVDSRLSGPITSLAENNVTPDSFIPSNTSTYGTSVVPKSVQSDCCREEILPTSVSGNTTLDNEDLVSNNAGLGRGENLVPSKRKVITVDMDSNVPSTLCKGNNCNLIPGALPSKLGGNKSCSKRVRLDYSPTGKESCDPCAIEHQDKDEIEGTMLQKIKTKNNPTSGIGHMKVGTVEDENTRAFLGGQSDNEDCLINNSNKSVVQPKEKLSSHIAYSCKSVSFRFVEYWVPAQLSPVQLEQYCAALLSNASILCSSPKIDSVGAIHDVLMSIRKCCNHPYVVDPSVQPLLYTGLQVKEYLDVAIKASGKLQLLDSMLTELKKKDLRALVLFQSIGGSAKVLIGDILDDFLRQRFEPDSYERIDKNLPASKKQAAIKKFNDKNNKRFVFLMETCACHNNIKLSSIDTIIIYDSDWKNPMNDIRSIQKITLDSQFELIKMFRFYSAFTVEEKALILARQDKTLDINLSTTRGLSHTLLMWGASHLFDELRVFHDCATSTSNSKPLLEETVSQFSSFISDAGEVTDMNNSILVKVEQNGGAYNSNSPLLGELKLGSQDEESPQTFWTKLLEGKQFQWKYSCSSSQRSRKRVQPFNNSAGRTDLVNEGIAKKRMKVSKNILDQPSSKSEGEKSPIGIKADKRQGNDVVSEKNGKVPDEQRSLHLSLKPQITKLCEVLLFPDDVKKMVDNFLEYVMNNHHVSSEPVSILQAFQISLIWTAASLLKHKVDFNASLILAKQHLNFDCKKVEVDYSYSLLRCLKKLFLHRTRTYNDTSSPKPSKSPNRVSYTEVALEVELFKKDLSKSIKEIQKKCEKRLNKLRLKQQEEKHRLRADFEDKQAEVERKHKLELPFTRSCSPNEGTRTEMLKILNIDHQKRIEELKFLYETMLKDLEDEQSSHILQVQDLEASWVEEVKSWATNELRSIVTLLEPGAGVDCLLMCDNVIESMKEARAMVPETDSPSVGKTIEQQSSLVKHDNKEMNILISKDRPVYGSEDHNTTENQYVSQENIISEHFPSRQQNSDGATSMTGEDNRCEKFGHGSQDGCVKPILDTTCLPYCREQNSDGATSMTNEDNRCANFGHGSRDGCEMPSLDTTCLPNCENATYLEDQYSDGVSSSVPEGEVSVEPQGTTNEGDSVSLSERQVQDEMPATRNATPPNPPSSVDRISNKGSIDVPVLDGVLTRPCQNTCSTSCQDATSLSNLPLEHQIHDCHKDIEPSTNAMLVDNITTNDQEGGVLATVTSAPVSGPVSVVEPLEQGQQFPSVESAADNDSVGEMQNSSKQVQLASSSADAVPANQITVPSKQVHQLAASGPSSNFALSNFQLATEEEHQQISVCDLPSRHPEASSVIPDKVVGQPHSNLDQVAVHPASNSDLDSLTASRVRSQSSNPRNLSAPLGLNNHPIQSTAPSSSRMQPHFSHDSLKIELQRIQKVIEQTSKNHDNMKLRLKSDFEKELKELRRKYDLKFQENEVEFQQTKKTLDTHIHTVCMSKILADAFRSKCLDHKENGASGLQHDSLARPLFQLPRQQTATLPLLASGSSYGEPPATSLRSPSIALSSQHTVQPGYNMSRTFSGVSTRSPLINTTRSQIGRDIQAGGEIRAPAPHLQSSRPPTSVPSSSFHPPPHGIPSHTRPTPSYLQVTSPSYAHVPLQQRPTTYQSDPQMGRRPDTAGRLATLNIPFISLTENVSNLSNITPPNVTSRLSDLASANLSRLGSNNSSVVANSSHQAASSDLVWLSDDD